MTETVTCIECDTVEELRWVEDRNQELRRRQMCFIDTFWAELLEADKRHLFAVVTDDYVHYWIGDEDASPKRGPGRGFDGRRFRVSFKDGRVLWTTNLWHQGTIPENWQDRYIPNAEVVSDWNIHHECGPGCDWGARCGRKTNEKETR